MSDVGRAFVLAAGFGTRLRPLTEELPKPAWPFFDVPLAAHVLRSLAEGGVGEAIVNLHHLGDRLKEALHPWIPRGMGIRWSPEEPILGTGGALEPWRQVLSEGAFFLLNADTYQEICLADLARFHREREARATLAVRRVAPGTRAPIEVDGCGRIVRFLGARAPGSVGGIPCEFTGVHRLEPEVLAALPGGPCCINADVHARLVAQGLPYFGYDPGDEPFWSDLGTPDRYLSAHRHFLARKVLPAGCPGRLVARDEETREGGRILAPSYLGPGARVEAGAAAGPNAVLGAGSVAGQEARVVGSVLWSGARIFGERLENAVLSASGTRVQADAPKSV